MADYTEKILAEAWDECGTEHAELVEFRFAWDDFHFMNHRFFVVKRRVMDYDRYCFDRFYNDLKTAYDAFVKEADRKIKKYDGTEENNYKPVRYCDDWNYYEEELEDDDDEYVRSSSAGDYGPSNPWDAPGMKVSDFLPGVL